MVKKLKMTKTGIIMVGNLMKKRRILQIPCFETRSDGRDNFVGALILAGNYNIPEVCVYFRHQLMRGNRVVISFHSFKQILMIN